MFNAIPEQGQPGKDAPEIFREKNLSKEFILYFQY